MNRKIAISVILQDAGEATRAIEIAKGLMENKSERDELEIFFLSHGSPFEQKVIDSGFHIHKCKPDLPGIGFHNDLQTTSTNLIGNAKLVKQLLDGQIQALNELLPDFLLYGFWPIAGLARRMTTKIIPGISYLPIPFLRDQFVSHLMKDVPDMIKPLTYLPLSIKQGIWNKIPKKLKLKAPIVRQTNILEALSYLSYDFEVKDLFDMLKADYTIVNDFQEFYDQKELPANVKVVGPLYAPPYENSVIDKHIKNLFSRKEGKINIFCTLGSSGKKKYLFEAIKAIIPHKEWNALILAPKSVCPLKEAQDLVKDCEHIYITDSFVPAPLINKMAHIVLSHGGQGTVQTAIASGTPIVGFAMQPEQQINLDNVVMENAGIRLPIHRWKSSNIQRSIHNIISNSQYKKNMESLQMIINQCDGKKSASEAIWTYMKR